MRNQRSAEDDERPNQSASIIEAVVLTMTALTGEEASQSVFSVAAPLAKCATPIVVGGEIGSGELRGGMVVRDDLCPAIWLGIMLLLSRFDHEEYGRRSKTRINLSVEKRLARAKDSAREVEGCFWHVVAQLQSADWRQ